MAHELDDRLRSVEVGQATLTQAVNDYTVVTSALITKHDKTLYGTGERDNPGLSVRVDREEQKSKNITRVIWIVVTGAIGMGMTYAATAIF
jgi:hypothetical protein